MSAPLFSLRPDLLRSNAFPTNHASSPFAASGQGAGAAMRSADLFGQLLRLPARQPASLPIPERSPNTATETGPAPDDDLVARTASDASPEVKDKPASNEAETAEEADLSAATETAGALAVAASEGQRDSHSASDLALSESAALSDSDAGQSLQALEIANSAEGELASELRGLNASNTEGGATSLLPTAQGQLELAGEASLRADVSLDIASGADSGADSSTATETKANHEILTTTLTGDRSTDALKEGTAQRSQLEADESLGKEQAINRSSSGEATSTQERSAKGDRRQRGKWYEQDAAKVDQAAANSMERHEPQSEKQLTAEARTDALADAAAESPPPHNVAHPELNPLPVDSLASSAALIAAESSSIGGGSTSEMRNAATGSTSSSTLELGEGVVGSNSSQSASRSASETQRSGAVQPGDSTDLTQQEKIRLIQRVTRSFNRLGVDGGQVNLRLHPPQLGSLNVQVRLEGRTMTAKLTTETGAARDAILESLPILKSRLAEQGFEISQFQVEVANNDQADASLGGNAGEQAYDQQAYRQHQQESPYSFRSVPRTTVESIDATRPVGANAALGWQTSTGIDIQA